MAPPARLRPLASPLSTIAAVGLRAATAAAGGCGILAHAVTRSVRGIGTSALTLAALLVAAPGLITGLARPPAAGAATYCVTPATGCDGGTLPTVAAALTAASDNPGPDEVRLGATHYSDGPWAYEDLAGTNPVTIRGDASGSSKLSSATGPTLTLVNGDVDGAEITAPPGATGVSIQEGTVANSLIRIGTDGTGVDALHAQVEHSGVVSGTYADGSTAVKAGDDVAVADIEANTPKGIDAAGFNVSVRRTSLHAWGPGGFGVRNSIHVSISDTHIRVGGDPTAVAVPSGCTDFTGGIVTATNLTITGDGTGKAFSAASNASCNTLVTASSSLVMGVAITASCDGPGSTIAVSYSDADLISPGAVEGICSFQNVDGGHNFVGDPKLNTDFRRMPVPRFDSPLVDAGDPAAPSPDQPTDRLGVPRAVNGRRDIGAFEYGRRAPSLSVHSSSPTAQPGQDLTFTAEASDPDPGDQVTVTWAFDDGTSATGAEVRHAFSGDGPHAATATATDSSGAHTVKTLFLATVPPGAGAPEPVPAAADPTRRIQPERIAAADAFVLPPSKRCVNRRGLRVRVRGRPGTTFVSATVTLNGRVARRLRRPSGITSPIVIRTLPPGRFTIRITLTAADGRSVTVKRTYRTCAPKRRTHSRRTPRRKSHG